MLEEALRGRGTWLYVMARGHSGSTIVDALLSQEAGSIGCGEFVSGAPRLQGDCACGSLIGDCTFWSAVRKDVSSRTERDWMTTVQVLRSGAHVRHFPRLLVAGRRNGFVREWAFHDEAIRSALTQQVSDVTPPFLVDSSKEVTRALLMARHSPGARVLHVLRDPEDICASNLWRIREGEGFKFMRRRFDVRRTEPLVMAASAAAWQVGTLLAFIVGKTAREGHFARIRYEDLMRDPERVLVRIESQLGIDLSNARAKVSHAEPLFFGHQIAGNRIRLRGQMVLRVPSAHRFDLPDGYRRLVRLFSSPTALFCGYSARRRPLNARPDVLMDARQQEVEVYVRKPNTSLESGVAPRDSAQRARRELEQNLSPLARGRLVFVTGAGRSGTSLVHSILGSHRDIYSVPENHYFRRHVAPLASRLRWETQGPAGLYQRLVEDRGFQRLGLSPDSFVSELRGLATRPSPETAYLHLLSMLAPDDYRLVVDKDPMAVFHIGRLLRIGARVVVIVRDPRDIVVSRQQAAWSQRWPSWSHPFVVEAQQRAAFLGGLGSRQVYSMRYETLVEDPETELRRLSAWLGLPFDAAVLDHQATSRRLVDQGNEPWKERTLEPITQGRRELWRQALPPELVVLTEQMCRTAFDKLGYEVSGDASSRQGLRLRAELFRVLYSAAERSGFRH